MSAMRILIIEDDRDAAAYLTKAFREAGHVADHAADGSTAMTWRARATMTSQSSTACCPRWTGCR